MDEIVGEAARVTSPGPYDDPASATALDDSALLAPAAPVIAVQPTDRSVAVGMSATFSVSLDRPDSTVRFQWRRDGSAILGATAASYAIPAAGFADAGRYTCDVQNSLGAETSESAVLTVLSPAEASRFVSFSVVTSLDAEHTDSTLEFAVGGAGTSEAKPILLRGVGPSLTRFGISNPHPAPLLELYSGTTKIARNNRWGGQASIIEAAARAGAFPLIADDSTDAAMLITPSAATHHTIKVSGQNGKSGVILAELYDATPVSAFTSQTPRLINFSVLEMVPAGSSVSAGFVISGQSTKTVLIRVIGPSLANWKVTNAMANPTLTLLQDVTPLASNDDWGGTPSLRAAATSAGAIPLDPSSKDAAVLVNLSRGSYAVQASDSTHRGGVALVEIYEVP